MNIDIEERAFCENIKQLRQIKGLTKKEMAKKLGIGVRSLTEIENGNIPPLLRSSVFFKILEHFGFLPSDMLTPSFFEHKADR